MVSFEMNDRKRLMLTIGLKSTMQFFMKSQNYKGTVSFGVGFLLVLIGWPIIDMILEAYGFVWLLAYSTCVSAEDPTHWMDFPTTFCYIVFWLLQDQEGSSLITSYCSLNRRKPHATMCMFLSMGCYGWLESL